MSKYKCNNNLWQFTLVQFHHVDLDITLDAGHILRILPFVVQLLSQTKSTSVDTKKEKKIIDLLMEKTVFLYKI